MKESSDTYLTDEALRIIDEHKPDFVFLYMVETDEKGGHDNGWMSEEYLRRISIAIDNVKRVIDAYGDEYSVIVMADHGGHDRSHGTTCTEDMTVPLFFYGEMFERGREVSGLSLLDIAPTIAAVMGISPEDEWEGHSIVSGKCPQ
jgi:phosphopentomutase